VWYAENRWSVLWPTQSRGSISINASSNRFVVPINAPCIAGMAMYQYNELQSTNTHCWLPKHYDSVSQLLGSNSNSSSLIIIIIIVCCIQQYNRWQLAIKHRSRCLGSIVQLLLMCFCKALSDDSECSPSFTHTCSAAAASSSRLPSVLSCSDPACHHR
jgi:hypothetical protein